MFMGDVFAGEYSRKIATIPEDTDVLVTHQPPEGILDFDGIYHYGAYALLHRVCQIKPKLHLFGHIHAAYGVDEQNGIIFSNSVLVDEKYQLKRERIVSLRSIFV